MGRWSDDRFGKKYKLDEYGYGDLDQLVYVGETTYRGGPDHFFKNGWPKFGKKPIIHPEAGTVSNVRSTSTNPLVSIAYSWYKGNGKPGWLYLVWCRRGFDYRKCIEKVGGKGAANDEVVMVSIEGYHVLGARKVERIPEDQNGGAKLGEVVTNKNSKLLKTDPKRYNDAISELTTMATPVTDLLTVAETL